MSWSQYLLFTTDPEEYRRRYFHGEQGRTSAALELGKQVAEALEKGTTTEGVMKSVVEFMPAYPKREYEILVNSGNVPILGKLDGFDEEGLRIGEYKTGRVKWTQARADKDGQLTWYAFCVYLKFGKMPSEIKLHWAETDYNQAGELELLGTIKTFTTTRKPADVFALAPKIGRAWKQITEEYEAELNRVFG